MASVQGTYRNGKVELDEAAAWPEGARVMVVPALSNPDDEFPPGIRSREALLHLMETFEPVEMTPEDMAEWEAARKEFKEYTLKKLSERFPDDSP